MYNLSIQLTLFLHTCFCTFLKTSICWVVIKHSLVCFPVPTWVWYRRWTWHGYEAVQPCIQQTQAALNGWGEEESKVAWEEGAFNCCKWNIDSDNMHVFFRSTIFSAEHSLNSSVFCCIYEQYISSPFIKYPIITWQ